MLSSVQWLTPQEQGELSPLLPAHLLVEWPVPLLAQGAAVSTHSRLDSSRYGRMKYVFYSPRDLTAAADGELPEPPLEPDAGGVSALVVGVAVVLLLHQLPVAVVVAEGQALHILQWESS